MTRTDVKCQLDELFYENIFNNAISKNKTELIVVPKELRGCGKTKILNSISTHCQIDLGMNVIVLTNFPKTEHICNYLYTPEDFRKRHLWVTISGSTIVILDDVNIDSEPITTILTYLKTKNIPVIGFVYN